MDSANILLKFDICTRASFIIDGGLTNKSLSAGILRHVVVFLNSCNGVFITRLADDAAEGVLDEHINNQCRPYFPDNPGMPLG